MKYHTLELPRKRQSKRPGRGISAGRGKTAGRGTKGQNSRSGGKVRPGFEGGQNPMMQRIPKLPGFSSRRISKQVVSLADLEKITGKIVDAKALADANVVASVYRPIKVVASGQIASPKTVNLQGASKTAIAAIQKAGGSFSHTDVLRRKPSKQPKEEK